MNIEKIKTILGIEGDFVFTNGTVFVDGVIVDVAPEKLLTINNAVKAEALQIGLMFICDSKQEAAQKMILGYKSTPLQIERYKDKYERAVGGEFEPETNALIIEKFEAMRSDVRGFTDLIEEFRGVVDDFIQAGELEKAQAAISAAALFSAPTTKDDVVNLLGSV